MKFFSIRTVGILVWGLFSLGVSGIYDAHSSERTLPKGAVLFFSHTGYYTCEKCAVALELTVFEDGRVQTKRYFRNSEPQETLLGHLTEERIQALRSRVNELHQEPLVDLDPSGGHCTDAGVQAYYGVLSDGAQVEFFVDQECHKYRLRNGTYWIEGFIEIIKGFRRLAGV